MVKQTLPCAEKNCKSKMSLTEKNNKTLYYNCIEKHNEHAFRYDITQKKWEKIVIKSKLILNYNEDPCEVSVNDGRIDDNELEKMVIDPVDVTETASNIVAIKGIGAKRARELEFAGVKTISDLAKCSPKDLSEKTGIPIIQISNWIVEANNLSEQAIILSA